MMPLDNTPDGEGEPLDEGGPEWESVEQERDYWKSLALGYAAKLKALELTFAASFTVQPDRDGKRWVVQTDDPFRAYPVPSMKDVLK
jgi:hypothetical protein